jgi:hypothetical protein
MGGNGRGLIEDVDGRSHRPLDGVGHWMAWTTGVEGKGRGVAEKGKEHLTNGIWGDEVWKTIVFSQLASKIFPDQELHARPLSLAISSWGRSSPVVAPFRSSSLRPCSSSLFDQRDPPKPSVRSASRSGSVLPQLGFFRTLDMILRAVAISSLVLSPTLSAVTDIRIMLNSDPRFPTCLLLENMPGKWWTNKDFREGRHAQNTPTQASMRHQLAFFTECHVCSSSVRPLSVQKAASLRMLAKQTLQRVSTALETDTRLTLTTRQPSTQPAR